MHAGQPPSYPHLDARLQQLTGAALYFWGDPAVRQSSLQAVLDAYTAGDQLRLDAALLDVDVAVVAGMQALGFRRGPINGIRIRRLASLGLKRPTCVLEIDVRQMRRSLALTYQHDSVVETWIHESVHGRSSPWTADFRSEQTHWLGYEEGLAEGLTRVIMQASTLTRGMQAYVRYRRGFELLADALGVTPEHLYRQIWPHEPGSVRRAFTDVVSDLYHLSRGRLLTLQERWELQQQADAIFDTALENVFSRTIERAMRNAWQGALP